VRTSVFKNVERYLAGRSSQIIAISDRQKTELVEEHRICRADKVTVIPLGLDLSKFREDQDLKRALFRRVYGVADDEVAIGIVGRLVPVKNHALFLKGMQHVRDRTGKKVRAFVVGDGEERESIQRAAGNSLSMAHARSFNGGGFGHGVNGKPIVDRADITFTSWVREIDIVHAGVDAVALTSFNEGTPVSLIEAQAASRAVVSTRVGGIENVVNDGVTGLLSANNDARSFGKTCCAWWMMPLRPLVLRRMGTCGRALPLFTPHQRHGRALSTADRLKGRRPMVYFCPKSEGMGGYRSCWPWLRSCYPVRDQPGHHVQRRRTTLSSTRCPTPWTASSRSVGRHPQLPDVLQRWIQR
jgi:glycosyltransferase involved in cell wall biosynthesis